MRTTWSLSSTMTKPVYLVLVWLGVLSAFTLLLFGWDKLMAKLGRRRIP